MRPTVIIVALLSLPPTTAWADEFSCQFMLPGESVPDASSEHEPYSEEWEVRSAVDPTMCLRLLQTGTALTNRTDYTFVDISYLVDVVWCDHTEGPDGRRAEINHAYKIVYANHEITPTTTVTLAS